MRNRLIYTLGFLLAVSINFYAQSVDRALKNIEKKEFDKALEQLLKLHQENSGSILVNIGLAAVYSADSNRAHNYFIAWQYANAADQDFSKLEEKEKEVLNDFLFNMELRKSSIPVRQKYDKMYKDIENKLIKYVREEKDLAMVNEFIIKFPKSKFYENVLHIRNYLEFGEALKVNTIEGYEVFTEKFPDAAQVPQAVELRDNLAYESAKKAGTIEAILYFIKTYPHAPQIEEAIMFRNELAFNAAKKANTIEAFVDFIKNYPDALQAPAALKLKRQLVYEKAKQVNTFEAYTEFIKNYPEGEQFVDVFNLRSNALAARYINPGSISSKSKLVWSRAYDFSGYNDQPGGLVLGPQGEIVCCGSSSAGESGFQEAWLMKLSSEGKLVWNKTYPANQGSHAATLQLAGNGDIYFSGYSIVDISQAIIQGWFGKVNPDGFRYYDRTSSSQDIHHFRLLGDKELLLSGYSLDSTGMPSYWLNLVKENGKNIWTRSYTTNGIVHALGSGPAGEIYMAGGIWSIKTDHSGYIVWEYFPESKDSIVAMNVTALGDIQLFSISKTGELKFIRLSKAGKKVAEKSYPDLANFHLICSKTAPSGELWMGGILDKQIVLLRMTENGLMNREFSMTLSPEMSLSDFQCLPQGGQVILLSGTSPDTAGDVLVLKLVP